MTPKYLNKHGNFRIGDLFNETTNRDAIYNSESKRALPIFTLKPEDYTDPQGTKLISMQKLFIEHNDPTGYDFAIKILGSYEHFLQLCAHKVIGTAIENWKEVIKSRLDSESISEIKRISTSGGTQVELSAAKYLANREYESKGSVGRPDKKRNRRKEAIQARELSLETKEEMERLGLTQH